MERRRVWCAIAVALIVATSAGCGSDAKPPETATTSKFPSLPPQAKWAPPEAYAALPEAHTQVRVVLYGDSLSLQALPYAEAIGKYRGQTVSGGAFGGLALCDETESIAHDLTSIHPKVLVLEFVGNAITPCMKGLAGKPTKIAAQYGRDLEATVAKARAAGAHVNLVLPLHMQPKERARVAVAMTAMMHRIASAHPGDVTLVDPNPTIAPHGYTKTGPCASYETAAMGCHNGKIVLRAHDGTHFPAPISTSVDYCAGAWRFAVAMVGSI